MYAGRNTTNLHIKLSFHITRHVLYSRPDDRTET